MKCILIDDELPGLKYLKLICEQIPGLEIVKAFDNPSKFLQESKRLDYDFCIMDIEMPELDGLQVATLIREKPVIFVTAYKQYAAEAFDLDAVDYVRKPIQKERLVKAIEKLEKRLQKAESHEFIQLNTQKGKTLISTSKLLMVKVAVTDPRDKVAMMDNGEEITLKNISFDALSKRLPQKQFCRINKQTVIALKMVSYYSQEEVTMQAVANGGQPLSLPLSEVYRKEFLLKLSE